MQTPENVHLDANSHISHIAGQSDDIKTNEYTALIAEQIAVPGDAAGPIRDGGGEADEAVVGRQTPVDHSAQSGRVDVAAAKQHHHILPVVLPEQRPAWQDRCKAKQTDGTTVTGYCETARTR